MNRFIATVISMLFLSTLSAQTISFNSDGKLKIAQFTDLHYIYGEEPSALSKSCIESVLDAEKPDLAVLTGDIVITKDVEKGWNEITELFISRGIPYAVTIGNHDDEGDLDREQVARLVEKYPLSLFKAKRKGVTGYGNYTIPILSSQGKSIATVIYCMDSRSYSTIEGIDGYGWFAFDQIEWYIKESGKYKAKGVKDRGLAFFHIALPEYKEAFDSNRDKSNIGQRREVECAPRINTGMFAAMVQQADVKAISVGHDHKNDYVTQKDSIALCYGQFSGSNNTYGFDERINGARIFILEEGEDSFETYRHLMDGKIEDKATIEL